MVQASNMDYLLIQKAETEFQMIGYPLLHAD